MKEPGKSLLNQNAVCISKQKPGIWDKAKKAQIIPVQK